MTPFLSPIPTFRLRYKSPRSASAEPVLFGQTKSTGSAEALLGLLYRRRKAAMDDKNGVMNQETITQAWEVLQDAYQAQMEGDYELAVELYQSSLGLHPTAEARTILGWSDHFHGKLEDPLA